MKFHVLALDYDGTVATDGVLDPTVRAAIAQARADGVLVLFVTGRLLGELERVTGCLNFVDGVVAENGAVLAVPSQQRTVLLGPAPPPDLLRALDQEGIQFGVGQCVVEVDASDTPDILATLRELELPLTIAFNRSRAMVLPQGVTKASGLHEMLRAAPSVRAQRCRHR